MRVDDPSVLPLANSATADPNDTVVGIDFSGASGTVVAQLNAALNGSNLQFSGGPPNRSTDVLTVLEQCRLLDHQFSLGNDHGDVADRRQRRSAAVHRQRRALHRRDQCVGLPDYRPGATSYGQPGARCGSFAAGGLQHLAIDAVRRLDPRQLHHAAAHRHKLSLFAADRRRQQQRALQGDAAELHAAIHQSAGRRRVSRPRSFPTARTSSSIRCRRNSPRRPASTSTRRWRICCRCRTPMPPMRG